MDREKRLEELEKKRLELMKKRNKLWEQLVKVNKEIHELKGGRKQ